MSYPTNYDYLSLITKEIYKEMQREIDSNIVQRLIQLGDKTMNDDKIDSGMKGNIKPTYTDLECEPRPAGYAGYTTINSGYNKDYGRRSVDECERRSVDECEGGPMISNHKTCPSQHISPMQVEKQYVGKQPEKDSGEDIVAFLSEIAALLKIKPSRDPEGEIFTALGTDGHYYNILEVIYAHTKLMYMMMDKKIKKW